MKEAALGIVIIFAVGLAYLWFNGIFMKSTTMTEKEIHAQIIAQSQRIFIDTASGNTVYIRGIGTEDVPLTSVSFFIDNVAVDNINCSAGTIPKNSVIMCLLPESCSGKRLKATAPGNHDSITCI